MNFDSFTTFCTSLEEVTEEFPFGPETLVYKVRGKIFAITSIEDFKGVSLKCDPELAIELREHYPGVTPGYHLNKKHWNSVRLDQSIPDKLIREWIQHSYELVKSKAPLKKTAVKKKAMPAGKKTALKSAKKSTGSSRTSSNKGAQATTSKNNEGEKKTSKPLPKSPSRKGSVKKSSGVKR